MRTSEHHREQFELAYATAWAKDRDGDETPEQLAAEIKAWRVGDTYEAEFIRLRFGWEGYQWARAGQCLAQIEEPAQPVAEICSASHDDAQFGERAIKLLRDISGFEYGTQLYAGAAPAAVAPQGERQWICPTRTVADLVNNLLTMDQALPIYGAQYIEKDGRRRAIAVPPTVSRQRVQDGRWIGQGNELNAAVVWTRAEQPAAVAGPAWGEQQVHALAIHMAASAPPSHNPRDYDADMAWAHSALGFIAGHAPAAPALEAPPGVAGRTTPRNDDERAAAQFFADNPSAAMLAWPLYLARDKSPALEAPAAPAPNIEGLLDEDGENQAVRTFLMLYGTELTVARLREDMELAGWPQAPGWTKEPEAQGHLTKEGAQDWLRHLFALEASPLAAAPVGKATEARISAVMELAKEWSQCDLIAAESGIDALSDECSEKDRKAALLLSEKAEEAYRAIESALRTLLEAAPQAPAAPSVNERAAYIEFLTGKFPRSYGKEEAGRWWDQGHVSALTWQAARAAPATPAAPAVDAETIHLQDLKNALAECQKLRQQLTLMDEQQADSIWRWQADGQDQLASMGNRMGVLIYACDLRALLAGTASAMDARESVARAIWAVMREYEDRCDMELEDMGEHCHAWALADAAIAAQAKGGAAPAVDADGARYRYLRDEHIGDDPESINLPPGKKRGLDSAVDAAIAAQAAAKGADA